MWSHSPHGWRGCGSALFCAKALEAGTSLHSLFSARSHIRPAGRLGKCLTLPSDFHQNISSFLCLCACYLPVLFEIISVLFYFSIPASKRRASLSVFVWLVAYFQEHDTGKKHGFKAILLQVNSGNHLCKCSCCSLWKINPDWRWRPLIWRGTDCTHSAVSLPSRGNQSICEHLLQYSHTCASGLRQKWKIKILKSDNHKVPLLFFCCRTCSDLLLKN